ncbi:glycoside hydrolase family 15 protein [Lapillicoccus jejuensis]|uniref:Trehalase n=1 Tax=Lapillicoccus jejuensis TaxID=402171 RepID=A0A542E629_9MICO|nr:glycoside hydrolase family 15 protein [Lapillicoccus jejuensis]TQJ10790.1 GH15 family glucan-1,4-alpha-glucosidase [Lapillicoccus jejuensis]
MTPGSRGPRRDGVTLGSSRTVPIADYGFLSDGEVTALVAPGGSVDWMCLPRFDSPSVFGAVLGGHAGHFRVAPADMLVPAARRYLPGTMILETSWGTASGWLVVRDVLLIGPWRHEHELSHTHRRTPTDYDAEHVLLRTIRCVSGDVQVVVECEPVLDYGRERVHWEYTDGVYHQARCAAAVEGMPELTLTTDLRLGFEGGQASARTLLREGDERFVALSWGSKEPPEDYADAYRRLVWTAHHWQHWLARGHFPDHPWRSQLQRSALTLKGLTYSPTGAIAAAATTSLPETLGGERNYDYRYTWIRDASFALWAMYSLGFDWEAVDFFSFIADIAERDSDLQVMYGVGGERDLPESELDHLPGYANSRPVRVGNAASTQQQHDVWGALLDSVYLHSRAADHLDSRIWPILANQVGAALKAWREPDAGIWEVRGEPRHFVSSKIMCWVAVDRGARLASMIGQPGEAARWEAAAEEIKADILEHGLDARGVLTQSYGSSALDASLLLAPLVRFLPPDDPRIRATVLAIADELTVDGFVLRYRTEETDDGFTGEEGSFTICSFWLVSALSEIGEVDRARELCARLLSFSGPLELFAEEIDPHDGSHLGNFPQAFTHLALINAVLHCIRDEERAEMAEADARRFG